MNHPEKTNPEIQPLPIIPVSPSLPEIISHPDKNQGYQPLPEIKPNRDPEINPKKDK